MIMRVVVRVIMRVIMRLVMRLVMPAGLIVRLAHGVRPRLAGAAQAGASLRSTTRAKKLAPSGSAASLKS